MMQTYGPISKTPIQPMAIPTEEQRQQLREMINSQPKESEPKKADAILRESAEVMVERGKQYDKPDGERSMGKTVAAFNIITGLNLRESHGWLLMQILKDVRDNQKESAHEDSLVDGVAYSALKAEARLQGK